MVAGAAAAWSWPAVGGAAALAGTDEPAAAEAKEPSVARARAATSIASDFAAAFDTTFDTTFDWSRGPGAAATWPSEDELIPIGLAQERVRPRRVRPERPSRGPNRVRPNRGGRPDGADQAERPGSTAAAGREDGGFRRLATRLRGDRPIGRGVTAMLVEAEDGAGGFLPDVSQRGLESIDFVIPVPGETSAHATATAQRFFGGRRSAASGIDRVVCLSASRFLREEGLHLGAEAAPRLASGVRVVANAWVGSVGEATREALVRADFAAAASGAVFVCGLPNAGARQPLLSGMLNGIDVGTIQGDHAGSDAAPVLTGVTPPPGSGQAMLVAPGNTTSAAVPYVAAAAAVLLETADEFDAQPELTFAGRPEVVIATLLAGAARENRYRGSWSNGAVLEGPDRGRATTPLDPAVGAGSLDVDAAQQILAAGFSMPSDPVPAQGWAVLPPTVEQAVWPIEVGDAGEVTLDVVAHWFAAIVEGVPGMTAADCALELVELDARGVAGDPLVGQGPDRFRGGNVVSDIPLGNVEALHVVGLAPGRYGIRVRRSSTDEVRPPVAVAWRTTTDVRGRRDGPPGEDDDGGADDGPGGASDDDPPSTPRRGTGTGGRRDLPPPAAP